MVKSSIFNFTHVYEAYGFMQGEAFEWVDCTQIEGTDCYCDTEAERQLKQLMAPLPLEAVHWIDSGDYHYMSKLWIDRIDEPFTLMVLDHHPDMQRPMFGELLSCGSWVREALEQHPMLLQVWLIGVDDKLLGEAQGFGERVKVVPESRLLTTPIEVVLQEVAIEGPVYLSIDKDVMSPNECTTNWDQGSMSWKQLEAIVGYVKRHRVLGVDVCGEEPKMLTHCCYGPDATTNEKFNEALWQLIIENQK